MEFDGSNGKQGCLYHSKLQGSGSAIPHPNAHTDSNYGDIIINIGIAHSNSYAKLDSNRNAAT